MDDKSWKEKQREVIKKVADSKVVAPVENNIPAPVLRESRHSLKNYNRKSKKRR